MQHIDNFDIAKPFSEVAKLAAKEPVSIDLSPDSGLVVMSREEYARMARNSTDPWDRFESACRALSEEARRNGFTQEMLDEILADER